MMDLERGIAVDTKLLRFRNLKQLTTLDSRTLDAAFDMVSVHASACLWDFQAQGGNSLLLMTLLLLFFFLMTSAFFYTKWLRRIRSLQTSYGEVDPLAVVVLNCGPGSGPAALYLQIFNLWPDSCSISSDSVPCYKIIYLWSAGWPHDNGSLIAGHTANKMYHMLGFHVCERVAGKSVEERSEK